MAIDTATEANEAAKHRFDRFFLFFTIILLFLSEKLVIGLEPTTC